MYGLYQLRKAMILGIYNLRSPLRVYANIPGEVAHPPRGGGHYLRLSLRNQLVKLSLHEWPLCGTGTAGQEGGFLQQALRPLHRGHGAHPSLHDHAELAQPASQQGLQRKQRELVWCPKLGGTWKAKVLPGLQNPEDGWAFYRLRRWEKVELSHKGKARSFPTKVWSFRASKAPFLILTFAPQSNLGKLSLYVADEQTEVQRPCSKLYRSQWARIKAKPQP